MDESLRLDLSLVDVVANGSASALFIQALSHHLHFHLHSSTIDFDPSTAPESTSSGPRGLHHHPEKKKPIMSLVNLANVCSHLQNASLARLGLTSIPYTRLHLSLALLLHKQGFFSQVKLGGPAPPLSCFPPGTQHSSDKLPTRGRDREAALGHLVNHRQKVEYERRTLGNLASEDELKREVSRLAEDLVARRGFEKDDVAWAQKYSHLPARQIIEEGVEVESMGLTIPNQRLEALAETIDTEDEGVVTQENRASRRLWLGLKYWNGEPVLRKARLISKPKKRMWVSNSDLGRIARGGDVGEVKGLKQIGEVMAVSTDRGIMDVRECVERRVGGQPLARFWG